MAESKEGGMLTRVASKIKRVSRASSAKLKERPKNAVEVKPKPHKSK